MPKHWWFKPSIVGNGVLWLVAVAMQIGSWQNQGVAYLLLVAAILWTLISIVYWSRHRTQGVAIEATLEDNQGSYGRSVDGQLSTATVFVEVTAENTGASDVRIIELRCELYRRRFGFWTQRVEKLPYYPIGNQAPLDWLLVANGLPDCRSVTFSRRSDHPWSFAKVRLGETLRARMIIKFSSGLSPLVKALPDIFVKGPYSGGSS